MLRGLVDALRERTTGSLVNLFLLGATNAGNYIIAHLLEWPPVIEGIAIVAGVIVTAICFYVVYRIDQRPTQIDRVEAKLDELPERIAEAIAKRD